jgi:hypothetical protein
MHPPRTGWRTWPRFLLAIALTSVLLVVVLQDRALAEGTGANSWSQLAKLTAGAGSEGDEFGSSIALDDMLVVAGAPGSYESPGFAYVVMMPDVGWGGGANETIRLTTGEGAAGDGFGASVSIDGSTVVVGSPGAGQLTCLHRMVAAGGGEPS